MIKNNFFDLVLHPNKTILDNELFHKDCYVEMYIMDNNFNNHYFFWAENTSHGLNGISIMHNRRKGVICSTCSHSINCFVVTISIHLDHYFAKENYISKDFEHLRGND